MMATTVKEAVEVEEEGDGNNLDDVLGIGGSEAVKQLMATLELQYFKAVSLYRRRNYEKCVDVCNAILEAGQLNNVQMFTTPSVDSSSGVVVSTDVNVDKHNRSSSSSRYGSNLQHWSRGIVSTATTRSNSKQVKSAANILPTWMMEGVWQLKMRALSQRVFIDDLEINDIVNEELDQNELARLATAARPGTTIGSAVVPRPRTGILRQATASSVVSTARPVSGVARPGSAMSRPGTKTGYRPSTRGGTASQIRAMSAAAFNVNSSTNPLFQAAKHNPTIYAERTELVKTLFQYLYFHEADVPKALSLCQAVMEIQQKKLKQQSRNAQKTLQLKADFWWWQQQLGRCLLMLRQYREAESQLQQSLQLFTHPDTYLLLSRVYQRMKQPQDSLALMNVALEKYPFDVNFRLEQGHLFDLLNKPDDALNIFRLTIKLNPVNIEALAGIADNYFYDNNPELALMYYRRILSLGEHTAEIYCNIGLCCLYGGQIDLVYPCFERALALVQYPEQAADIWYNLSFVAVTTGDFVLARRCLQLCLAKDGQNAAALNNLAVLSAYNGDYGKAKSYLTAARHLIYDAPEIEKNWQYLEEHYKL